MAFSAQSKVLALVSLNVAMLQRLVMISDLLAQLLPGYYCVLFLFLLIVCIIKWGNEHVTF